MKRLNRDLRSKIWIVLFCLIILSFFYIGRTIFVVPETNSAEAETQKMLRKSSVPKGYGELKSVSIFSPGKHLLWFEDKQGIIRVVFHDVELSITEPYSIINRD